MDSRQALWGLSTGVSILGLGGAFWMGLAAGSLGQDRHWALSSIAMVLQIAGVVLFIRAGLRLRREAQFCASDLRHLHGPARDQARTLNRSLLLTTAAEGLLSAVAVGACVLAGAQTRIFPSIAIVVSLHFAPLGRIFRLPAYFALAAAGTIVGVWGFTRADSRPAQYAFASGMAVVTWLTAAYLVKNASRVAASSAAALSV